MNDVNDMVVRAWLYVARPDMASRFAYGRRILARLASTRDAGEHETLSLVRPVFVRTMAYAGVEYMVCPSEFRFGATPVSGNHEYAGPDSSNCRRDTCSECQDWNIGMAAKTSARIVAHAAAMDGISRVYFLQPASGRL